MPDNSLIRAFGQQEHQNQSPFDTIRRIGESGEEYWLARELMKLLGYAKWERFLSPIAEAIENLEFAVGDASGHFFPLEGSSVTREGAEDYKLSRIACYHVALACDSRGKPNVKAARQYFVVKTRQAELLQQQVPTTFSEALMLAGKIQLEKERLEIENKMLVEENEQLAETVDELFNYSSIIRVAKYNKCDEKMFSWRKLKSTSIQMRIDIRQVPCPRFGSKNLYSHDVWRVAYPDFLLPETTTIRLVR